MSLQCGFEWKFNTSDDKYKFLLSFRTRAFLNRITAYCWHKLICLLIHVSLFAGNTLITTTITDNSEPTNQPERPGLSCEASGYPSSCLKGAPQRTPSIEQYSANVTPTLDSGKFQINLKLSETKKFDTQTCKENQFYSLKIIR